MSNYIVHKLSLRNSYRIRWWQIVHYLATCQFSKVTLEDAIKIEAAMMRKFGPPVMKQTGPKTVNFISTFYTMARVSGQIDSFNYLLAEVQKPINFCISCAPPFKYSITEVSLIFLEIVFTLSTPNGKESKDFVFLRSQKKKNTLFVKSTLSLPLIELSFE